MKIVRTRIAQPNENEVLVVRTGFFDARPARSQDAGVAKLDQNSASFEERDELPDYPARGLVHS